MKTNLKLSIITAAILASTNAIAFDPNLTPYGIGSSDSTLMGGITAGVLVPLLPVVIPPPPPPPVVYVPSSTLNNWNNWSPEPPISTISTVSPYIAQTPPLVHPEPPIQINLGNVHNWDLAGFYMENRNNPEIQNATPIPSWETFWNPQWSNLPPEPTPLPSWLYIPNFVIEIPQNPVSNHNMDLNYVNQHWQVIEHNIEHNDPYPAPWDRWDIDLGGWGFDPAGGGPDNSH